MEPITLPRQEFALCKIRDWSLYRLFDGRLVAHRKAKETVRKGEVVKWDEKFIAWPSDADDIPEATRKEFNTAASEWQMGIA